MTQPEYLHALDLKEVEDLDPDMEKYFDVCQDKLGMVPNVLRCYAHDQDKLRNFANFYGNLMVEESGLSKLEREMIAAAVSGINNCYYCQVAHGAAVRGLSGDPVLGEAMIMNYRAADLSKRHRAMLDFAAMITERAHEIGEADRQALRDVGFEDADIWDISAVAAFFNMTNRMASAVDMMPNLDYHAQAR